MIQRMTGVLDFQAQALTLRAERQRLIAGNIANADTPGYVARDFDFAAALRDAVRPRGPAGNDLGAPVAGRAGGTTSHPALRHSLHYALPAQTSMDGNSVDMDRERASFVDNSVKYEATLRFINGSVRTMLDAMKSHNQG
jgi:flagellar basal-body rod protein FlgB